MTPASGPVDLSGVTALGDALTRVADAFGDASAYIDASGGPDAPAPVMTYADWDRAATAVAATLADAGVRAGDRVALLLSPTPEYPTAYLAAARLGAITTGVNLRLGAGEIAGIVARTRPVVTIADDDADVPAGAGIVLRRREVAAISRAAGPAVRPRTSIAPDDPAAIVWTSGTTGAPKGAVYAHASLAAVAAAQDVLTKPFDVYWSAINYAHVGFMSKVWGNLAMVTTQVIAPSRWRPAEMLALLARHRVTVAGGVPTQWRLVLDDATFAATDLSALQRVIVAASFAEPSLIRELRDRLGVTVLNRYTSTEAAITTGTAPDADDDVVATTIGTAVTGVSVRLADESDRAVPDGEVGEIQCRSAAMFRGYWEDAASTAAAVTADGWLRTGDLAWRRPDANLVICGRRKDMYIRGGYNVYPAEVEARLTQHPAVAQAAVVGVPEPTLGEIGIAVIVTQAGAEGSAPTLAELRAFCAEMLADYKAPDGLAVTDALALTPMQKVDKAAIAAAIADGSLRVTERRRLRTARLRGRRRGRRGRPV